MPYEGKWNEMKRKYISNAADHCGQLANEHQDLSDAEREQIARGCEIKAQEHYENVEEFCDLTHSDDILFKNYRTTKCIKREVINLPSDLPNYVRQAATEIRIQKVMNFIEDDLKPLETTKNIPDIKYAPQSSEDRPASYKTNTPSFVITESEPVSPSNSITFQAPQPITDRKWKCNWLLDDGSFCPWSFDKLSLLKDHQDSVHRKLYQYKCDKTLDDGSPCPRAFRTKGGLLQHYKRDHSTERPFKCNQLNEDGSPCEWSIKGFPTKGELEQHIKRSHSEERPFKCNQLLEDGSVCPWSIKGFKSNGDLQQHISAVHLKEKKFFCNQLMDDDSPCPYSVKGFATNSTLQAHIKFVHLKLREYVCTWPKENGKPCGEDFQTKGNLTKHINIQHKGEIYAVCDWKMDDGSPCGAPCKHKIDYDRHIDQVHKGIRPYPCNVCGRPFVKSEARDHHQKSCIGPTPTSIRQKYHIIKGGNVENTVMDIIEDYCLSQGNIIITRQKELYDPTLGRGVLDIYCEGLEGKRIGIDVTTGNIKFGITAKWIEREYQSYPEVDELWVIVVANEWDRLRCSRLTHEAHKKAAYLNVYIYHWSDLRDLKMMPIPPKIWELLKLYEGCTLRNKEELKKYWEKIKGTIP